MYVGESLPPVPEKLAKKIYAWKFVDMAEMLLEHWWQDSGKEEEAVPSNSRASQTRCRRKITDLMTWLQCYALYVGVLAGSSPEAVTELMAYLVTILRASQDYTGEAWATYDAAFCRQAEVTGDKKWSRINPSLYFRRLSLTYQLCMA